VSSGSGEAGCKLLHSVYFTYLLYSCVRFAVAPVSGLYVSMLAPRLGHSCSAIGDTCRQVDGDGDAPRSSEDAPPRDPEVEEHSPVLDEPERRDFPSPEFVGRHQLPMSDPETDGSRSLSQNL